MINDFEYNRLLSSLYSMAMEIDEQIEKQQPVSNEYLDREVRTLKGQKQGILDAIAEIKKPDYHRAIDDFSWQADR